MKFGDLIRRTRMQKGHTAKELIKKLAAMGCSVSNPYYSQIELHRRLPSLEIIYRLADILQLDRKELLNMIKEEKITNYRNRLEKEYSFALLLFREYSHTR